MRPWSGFGFRIVAWLPLAIGLVTDAPAAGPLPDDLLPATTVDGHPRPALGDCRGLVLGFLGTVPLPLTGSSNRPQSAKPHFVRQILA